MPTYSYRCATCEFAFDQYQAFTDDSLADCPDCGEPKLRKVFNSIGVTFNGSGFYRNDSRADSAKSKNSSSTGSGSKSESPKSEPSKSSESKPAATGSPSSKSPETKAPAVSSGSKSGSTGS